MNFNFEISRVDCRYDIYIKQDKMERDCCEFICGAPMTFQSYGIEQNIHMALYACFHSSGSVMICPNFNFFQEIF